MTNPNESIPVPTPDCPRDAMPTTDGLMESAARHLGVALSPVPCAQHAPE